VLTSRVPVEGSAPAEGSQQLDLLSTEAPDALVISGRLPGRGVVSALHQAIRVAHAAANSALRTQGQLSAFYDGVADGVSANLCRALADLGSFGRHDAGEYRSFEIGFGWARGMPTDESSEPISFSENMVGILTHADEELTNLAKSGPARLVGKVETLKRGPGEQPRIRVIGELRTEEGNMLGRRSVWVTVSTAQYEEAWEAQRNGLDMVIDGHLGTSRGRLQMEPSRIEVTRP